MSAVYRADHIGSLLRPAELLQARSANIGGAQLRALEDKHILRLLEKQKELGFKIFTDGELRRGNFMSDFNDSVEGIDEGVAVARTWQTAAGASSRPSMVPGTVVGIAYIVAFNAPPLVLTGTAAILVLAYWVRRLPYSVRAGAAILQQIDPAVEEASVSLGVPPLRTFARVTARLMLPGIVSGAILTWVRRSPRSARRCSSTPPPGRR